MPLTTEERKDLIRTWGDRSGKGLVRNLCPTLYFSRTVTCPTTL